MLASFVACNMSKYNMVWVPEFLMFNLVLFSFLFCFVLDVEKNLKTKFRSFFSSHKISPLLMVDAKNVCHNFRKWNCYGLLEEQLAFELK